MSLDPWSKIWCSVLIFFGVARLGPGILDGPGHPHLSLVS